MSQLAVLQVTFDPVQDRYDYIAYSPLFDDVLMCEGEDPPLYTITVSDKPLGQVIIEASRTEGLTS
jgi:hypothetical protein